jgi:hypothetical protein
VPLCTTKPHARAFRGDRDHAVLSRVCAITTVEAARPSVRRSLGRQRQALRLACCQQPRSRWRRALHTVRAPPLRFHQARDPRRASSRHWRRLRPACLSTLHWALSLYRDCSDEGGASAAAPPPPVAVPAAQVVSYEAAQQVAGLTLVVRSPAHTRSTRGLSTVGSTAHRTPLPRTIPRVCDCTLTLRLCPRRRPWRFGPPSAASLTAARRQTNL